MMDAIRAQTPPMPRAYWAPHASLGAISDEISNSEIDEYNRALEKYYAACEVSLRTRQGYRYISR